MQPCLENYIMNSKREWWTWLVVYEGPSFIVDIAPKKERATDIITRCQYATIYQTFIFIPLRSSHWLGWQWESKSISVQKRWAIYQSISNHTWIVFRISSEEVKTFVTSEEAASWFWDRFCCKKKTLFATGSGLTRIIIWRLDVKLQTALGWTQNLKVRFLLLLES